MITFIQNTVRILTSGKPGFAVSVAHKQLMVAFTVAVREAGYSNTAMWLDWWLHHKQQETVCETYFVVFDTYWESLKYTLCSPCLKEMSQCSFHFHASCEFSTRAATFPFLVDTSRPRLVLLRVHLYLSCDFTCNHAVFKLCCQLFECTSISLTCSVPVCLLNFFHLKRVAAEHANLHVFVFSLDGSSKHVILFDNIEEALVLVLFDGNS